VSTGIIQIQVTGNLARAVKGRGGWIRDYFEAELTRLNYGSSGREDYQEGIENGSVYCWVKVTFIEEQRKHG
jgi:hypothetical protein